MPRYHPFGNLIGSRDIKFSATSSSSTSGRPVVALTHCMCWRPRSLTGRHSKPVWRMGLSCLDGQKMSKSLRNHPDVTEVSDRDGSDAMRWFLMASLILRGGN